MVGHGGEKLKIQIRTPPKKYFFCFFFGRNNLTVYLSNDYHYKIILAGVFFPEFHAFRGGANWINTGKKWPPPEEIADGGRGAEDRSPRTPHKQLSSHLRKKPINMTIKITLPPERGGVSIPAAGRSR